MSHLSLSSSTKNTTFKYSSSIDNSYNILGYIYEKHLIVSMHICGVSYKYLIKYF